MRLIDTQTHLLLEPWKAAGKEYAILSHTWGDQEVIFQEWEQLYPSGAIKGQCPHVRHRGIDQKAGYHKVMQACEQARRDGIRYLWCDTMCINKESSAELSEAINSMFKWYRDAKVCYVYLADVTFPNKKTRNGVGLTHSNVPGWFPYAMERKRDEDVREMKSRFMASRWWTRGWTLQELLAPEDVVFFTQDWTPLGHKIGIAHWISAWTRIHKEALEDHSTISNFSIAQRMSWAADRTTTVPEDLAYCLLGIFSINMPMLYGQGDNAFQKLQHEIIKASADQSIFAWTASPGDPTAGTGALAKSPAFFKHCGSIVRSFDSPQEPYSLTNVGFKMRVAMINNSFATQSFIGLSCFLELHGESTRQESVTGTVEKNRRRVQIWIPVRKRGYGSSYERIHFPTSHVYFQNSYPINKVSGGPEILLCESPFRASLTQPFGGPSPKELYQTGIAVAVGFGNMSKISRAYKNLWQPRKFQTIPIGTRGARRWSHEVVVSGSFCIILSVTWNEFQKPKMHIYTTLRDADIQAVLSWLHQLDQTKQSGEHFDDAEMLHKAIRSTNHSSVVAVETNQSPMIIVEDEPLYDMHQSAFVMVDIIFKEDRILAGEREQAGQDIVF
ncbi:hypothetical protein PFICI_07692 [Pestalotiopsis fici W106-1]|uniref:Heterokaryon incompatibility domain-containing protein n=1 Tax=Pestalotiopsis fici (strain W106-1 / CGMCC3.15140) TaxID=1229662 RepID=W3X206_PESFW|nr:uncharacterized protein PFICI_07692 [Pestalotiopsis fici W106-1]ETS80163.1 hypothetical protein PFICI_07692 [Pestalotiopsis fici W106-1]